MTFRISAVRQLAIVMAVFAAVALMATTLGISPAFAADGDGTLQCTRIDNADGTVTLNWTDDGDDNWKVRSGTVANSSFVVKIFSPTLTWTGGDVALDYLILSKLADGSNSYAECVVDTGGDGCSVLLLISGDVEMTWEDDGANTWAWRRGKDGAATSYKGEAENFLVVDVAPGPGTFVYELVSRFGGGVTERTVCGSVTIAPGGNQVCSITLVGGSVDIVFVDDGANSWVIRRALDGAAHKFVSFAEGFAHTDDNPPVGSVEYFVLSKFGGGNNVLTSCGVVVIEDEPPTDPVCTAVIAADGSVDVAWTDNGANSFAIRRALDGAASKYLAPGENFAYNDADPPVGDNEYFILSRFGGGVRLTTSCGTVTIDVDPPIVLVCTLTDVGDGTILVAWNDDGANKWSIRRGKNGATPSFKGETETPVVSFIDTIPADATSLTYEIVSRFSGGVKITTACGTIAVNVPA